MREGGWSREVTARELPAAKTVAGVNMRLTAGGGCELHWPKEAEWAFMLTGEARITVVDNDGHNFVADVEPGDLWYFPSGIPHSIQGLQPDGAEFLLAFPNGSFSEDSHSPSPTCSPTCRRMHWPRISAPTRPLSITFQRRSVSSSRRLCRQTCQPTRSQARKGMCHWI